MPENDGIPQQPIGRSLTATHRVRPRLPTRENQVTPPAERQDHFWTCWGDKDGPGARFRTEVRGELASIKSRITWYNGGVAVLSAIGMIVLAAWLSSKFAATERSAVKREDVAAAVQKSAEMVAAKRGDDIGLLKQLMDKAAVDMPALPNVSPMTGKARK